MKNPPLRTQRNKKAQGGNRMNVYDFDGTIFSSDCSIGFAIWCMNRHPKLWFTFFPFAVKNLILTQKGKMPDYLMRRKFFSFLTMIDDFDVQIERYWDKNEKKIASWYLFHSFRWLFQPVSIFFFTVFMVSGPRLGQSDTTVALFETKWAFSAHKASGVSERESE